MKEKERKRQNHVVVEEEVDDKTKKTEKYHTATRGIEDYNKTVVPLACILQLTTFVSGSSKK